MKEITINKNDANQRLDKFISKFMPKLPKGMLYKGLRKNCVRVNGAHIKDAALVLNEGDVVTLYFKDEFFDKKTVPKITSVEPDIVYEDENLLLINKPRGMVVHSDDRGTSMTLVDIIKSYLYKKGEYDPKSEHSFSPALANRLDRNTSGIIIAAKNAAALREVNGKIKERRIRKFYMCIVDGRLEGDGEISGYLTRGEKIVTVSDTVSDAAKEIKTKFNVVLATDAASLLEVELLTGRTHQIRAHLASIGHPLTGDKKYGSKTKSKGYCLCSYKLYFDFTPDGGVLDYLAGRAFAVSADFAKKFSSQNL